MSSEPIGVEVPAAAAAAPGATSQQTATGDTAIRRPVDESDPSHANGKVNGDDHAPESAAHLQVAINESGVVRIDIVMPPEGAAPTTGSPAPIRLTLATEEAGEHEHDPTFHHRPEEENAIDSPDAHDARQPVLSGHKRPFASSLVSRPSVSRSGIPSSLRRLPSAVHRTFAGLPDGVLTMALECLTSRELCVVARTDRRLADLTTRNSLWAVRCGFMQAMTQQQHAIRAQTNLKRRYLMYRQWRMEKIEREYALQTRIHRQRKLMCCMHAFDGPAFLCTLGVLVLLGLVLSAHAIEQSRGRDFLPAWAVWPFFCAVAFVVGLTACLCVARCDRRHRWCHPNSFPDGGQAEGIVRGILHLMESSTSQIGLAGGMFALACLWAVMLLCKWCGWITFSYWYVFLPLFIDFACLLLMCFHPMALRLRWRHRLEMWALAWCLLIGPCCAFAILACARMERGFLLPADATGDGRFLSWMLVMVPLFVLNFYVFLASVLISADERSLWAFGGALCCWGPILAFEVLLAHWLDHAGFDDDAPRFIHVWIPLWLFMSLCLLVAFSVCLFNRLPTTKVSILMEPPPERQPLLL